MPLQERTLETGILCTYHDEPADAPLEEHWTVLEQTTALIPAEHRPLVARVELRGHGEFPARGGGSDREARVIRLSHASLRESYNRRQNVTLLHEWGHHVDWHYDVTGWVAGQGENGRTLLQTGHTGATQGPEERIADCYMVYLIQVVADRPYEHRADPEAYRGSAARMRFGLLLGSPAFPPMAEVAAEPAPAAAAAP